MALTLLATVPGAYAVSRLRFFGRRRVSALFLAVYPFPATLPAVLHDYLTAIPVSLREVAALDGCSRLATIRWLVLPLALPSLMATGLYVFVIAWNEFLFALRFLAASPEDWTVSPGLRQLRTGSRCPRRC